MASTSRTAKSKAEALFFRALDLPASDRSQFVADECGGDATLREEVRTLLVAYEHAGAFLESPIRATPFAPQDLPDDPGLGLEVGAYRLVRQVGAGGMSRVYLAERATGDFDQIVAVKLLRRGIDDRDAYHRFHTECRILARLEHPNIARLIDAGLAANHQPFLVVEYIDGFPIDRYCVEHEVSLEQRLELFCTVCAAVHHAHRHSIIHRDLKPSNILVDRDGRVKLLDFGIGRILDEPVTGDGADRTATGLRAMTPPYASPEQIRGEWLSTSSDIYSLGVVLYKLLTGRLPYDVRDRSPLELERAISESAPRRPSALVLDSEDGDRDAERPSVLAAEPRRWSRRLSGDLDTIVLMALRKEPERRYTSAQQLAEDIRRHLDGRPVTAQPDTWRYRASKFVRRNALAVGAAATIAVLLVMSSVVAAVLYTRAERARLAAVTAQTAAEENARTAEEVADFLVGLFEVADPVVARGSTITAREIVDRGAKEIDSALAGEPVVQARLLGTLGAVYRNLGLYPDARVLFENALIIRTAGGTGSPLDVANSTDALAQLDFRTGDYAAARSGFQRVLVTREELLGPNDTTVAKVLTSIGATLSATGELDSAEMFLRRAGAIYDSAGVVNDDMTQTLEQLGRTLQRQGDIAGSLPLLERALAIVEERDPGHPRVGVILNSLAVANFRLGQYEDALALFRRSLPIAEAALGPDHPNVGTILNNMGVVARRAGDVDAARRLYLRSLEIADQTLGPDHPEVAGTLVNLVGIYVESGDLDSALWASTRARDIYEKALGERHPNVALAMAHMAVVLLYQGALERSRSLHSRASEVIADELGPEHPRFAMSLVSLTSLDRLEGAYDRAERRVSRACQILEAALAPGHQDIASCFLEWALLLIGRGDSTAAAAKFRAMLDVYDVELGPDHPVRMQREAQYWTVRGDNARAMRIVRRAMSLGHPTGVYRFDPDFAPLHERAEFQALVGSPAN